MTDNILALPAFDGPINSWPIKIVSFIIQIPQQISHGTHRRDKRISVRLLCPSTALLVNAVHNNKRCLNYIICVV